MDRRAHWRGVYAEKSPLEVSWYQPEPSLSLRLIKGTGCPKSAAVIDVGGGASTLVDGLLAAGYEDISVLDIAGQAMAHARQRLGDKAAAVNWIEADATEFQPAKAFDIWHDRAVFHFLTDAVDRARYVAALKRGLRSGGPAKCSGLDIVQYNAAGMAAEFGEDFALQAELPETHLTPSGREQKFVYFHFIR